MWRISAVLGALAALAATAPASGATGPGRETYQLLSPLPPPGRFAAAGTELAAVTTTPDGGAIVVGGAGGDDESDYLLPPVVPPVVLVVRRDGTPDPAFGVAGVGRPDLPHPFVPFQVLREPSGAILLVGDGAPIGGPEELRIARLRADGSLDPSYGAAGVTPAVAFGRGSGFVGTAAVASNGGVVVAGAAGTLGGGGPGPQFVVARFTPDGALDDRFGDHGIVAVPGGDAAGIAVQVLPDGRLVALGRTENAAGSRPVLVRLLPDGKFDPTFDGGAPLVAPFFGGSSLLAEPDGSTAVMVDLGVARFTAAGALDQSYGDHGLARLPVALATPQLVRSGDGVAVVGRPSYPPPGLRVLRLTPTGSVDTKLGGPDGELFALPQFGGDRVAQRPDGSLLLAGEGFLYAPRDELVEGSLVSIAASLDRLDPVFGGPSHLAARAALAARRIVHGTLRVRVRVSDGARIVVSAGAAGHAFARAATTWSTAAGTRLVALRLTARGRRLLRAHRRVVVEVRCRVDDLAGNVARAVVFGSVRR